MSYNTPPYMTPLSIEDLNAMNELATLTWAWEIKYWTEKGLKHGSFILSASNPYTNTWLRIDGTSVLEVINNFKKSIELV